MKRGHKANHNTTCNLNMCVCLSTGESSRNSKKKGLVYTHVQFAAD